MGRQHGGMIEEGDVVKIRGLRSNSILNGMEAIVVKFSADGRCSVLIAGKCLSIKSKHLQKQFQPVSMSLRRTLHQQELESFLKQKLLPQNNLEVVSEAEPLIERQKPKLRSIGVMTEAQPEVEKLTKDPDTERKEPKSVKFEEKHREESQSSLFKRESGGLFGRKKPAGALFNEKSKMSSLLNKMNSLGAVDTPHLANIPHLPTNPDLTKIFGTNKVEPNEKSVKQAKEGMAAMLDISVDEILTKVEGLRASGKATDPKLLEMLTVVDLIKEGRNSKRS